MMAQAKGKIPVRPGPGVLVYAPGLVRHSTEPPQKPKVSLNTSPDLLTPPAYEPEDFESPPFKSSSDDDVSLNQYSPHHSRDENTNIIDFGSSPAVAGLGSSRPQENVANGESGNTAPPRISAAEAAKKAELATPVWARDWTFGAKRRRTAASGESAFSPFQSIMQALEGGQAARKGSTTLFPGDDRRSSLVSTESSPMITATHAFGSLIGSDNKLRKSTTGKLVSKVAVRAFEQKKERRRSRAFFESDRIIGHQKRDKRKTPALITLRKASKQYNCAGYETVGRSEQDVDTVGRSKVAPKPALHTPESDSSRSAITSPPHVLMDSPPKGNRADPTRPAVTVNEAYAGLDDLEVARGRMDRVSSSVIEARRQSNTTHVSTGKDSQEIIWKSDGTPSSWSYNNSRESSAHPSSHGSDEGGIPLLSDRFGPHVSATLPTLAEELSLAPGVGPSSQRVIFPEQGAWPWDQGPSPTRSGVDVQGVESHHTPQERSPSPEAFQSLRVPRIRPRDPSHKANGHPIEHQADAASETRSPSCEFVFPKVDVCQNEQPSGSACEIDKSSEQQVQTGLRSADVNGKTTEQDHQHVGTLDVDSADKSNPLSTGDTETPAYSEAVEHHMDSTSITQANEAKLQGAINTDTSAGPQATGDHTNAAEKTHLDEPNQQANTLETLALSQAPVARKDPPSRAPSSVAIQYLSNPVLNDVPIHSVAQAREYILNTPLTAFIPATSNSSKEFSSTSGNSGTFGTASNLGADGAFDFASDSFTETPRIFYGSSLARAHLKNILSEGFDVPPNTVFRAKKQTRRAAPAERKAVRRSIAVGRSLTTSFFENLLGRKISSDNSRQVGSVNGGPVVIRPQPMPRKPSLKRSVSERGTSLSGERKRVRFHLGEEVRRMRLVDDSFLHGEGSTVG